MGMDGSVVIELRLERSRFDRDLRQVENLAPSLQVGLKLDATKFKTDLEALQKNRVNLSASIEIDADSFAQQVKKLGQSILPIKVDLAPNVDDFQEKLRRLSRISPINVEIKGDKAAVTSEFEQIGKYAAAGFAQGFAGSDNAAKSAIDSLVDSVKTQLGIQSPSRVFREIGKYAIEGLMQGLDSVDESKIKGIVSEIEDYFKASKITAEVGLEANISDLSDAISEELEVKVNLKVDSSELDEVTSQIAAEVKTKVEATVTVQGGSGSSAAGFENAIAKGMQSALAQESKGAKQDGMSQKFVDFTLSPLKAAYDGLKTVASGALQNIGMSFSQSFGNALSKGLDKDFGGVIQSLGAKVGESFGFLGKEITGKTKYKGALNQEAPKTFSELEQGLKPLANEINQIASIFKKTGLDVGGFATSIQKASASALSLISAFAKIETAIGNSKQAGNAPQAATQGFLTGNVQTLTPVQAKGQVEAARKQLEMQLAELKSLPQSSETRGKVAQLIGEITKLEAQIASDIKNSAIPESVRRSLGKLKGAGSKLAELKTEAEKTRLTMGSLTAKRDEGQFSAQTRTPSTANLDLYKRGSSASRDSYMNIEQEAKLAQANFTRIFKQVAKMSGLTSEQIKGAKLGVDFQDLGEGVSGSYNAKNNRVSLAKDFQAKLAQGIITPEELNTLIHEIRHALQLDFGKIRTTGLAAGKQQTDLKLNTKNVPEGTKKDIDASVEGYRQAFKQEFGKEPPKKLLDTIRKLETDAYLFADKAVGQISQNLAKILKLNPDKPTQRTRASTLPTPPPPPPQFAIPQRRTRKSGGEAIDASLDTNTWSPARLPAELKKVLQTNRAKMDAIARRISAEQEAELGKGYSIKTNKKLLKSGQIVDPEYRALEREQAQAALEVKALMKRGYRFNAKSTRPQLALTPSKDNIQPEAEIQQLQNTTNKAKQSWWQQTVASLRGIGKNINQSFNSKVSAKDIQLGNITTEIQKTQKFLAKTIEDVQQKLIAEGMNVTRANVAKMLRSGQYYDPQYAAGQSRIKELQQKRVDINKGEPTSLVNSQTAQKRLVAANDPIFNQLGQTQKKLDDVARRAQAEIAKETGQQYKLTAVKNLLRQGGFEGTSVGNNYAALQREKQQQIAELERRKAAAMKNQSPIIKGDNDYQRVDNFFRRLEAGLYRSQMLRGVPASQRRSMVSEASGFVFSGAAMLNPGATFGALLAPLAVGIMPLITTFGLLGNALKPLIDVVTETLKKLEPASKRLEFVSGSKEAAAADIKFVTNTSDKLDIPQLASIEGFSKLSAAAKSTELEGEGVKELFEGIATASKALQMSQEDLNGVMYGFTQSLSKQRFTAEEVRLQISERMPGAITALAKALKMSVPEFNEALESGKLGIDALAKAGKGLKDFYSSGAESASGGLLSALIRVDNAILKLQKGLADSFGPALTIFNNGFANLIGFISSNLDNIIKVFNVAVIGIGAQFLVGLTVILQGTGIPAKVAAFLTPLLARVGTTMAPFVLGIVSDLLDDVFGAKTSVMDNMMKGFYNMVLSVILVVDGGIKKIKELFNVADEGAKKLPRIANQEKPQGNRLLDSAGTAVVGALAGGLAGGAKGGAVGAIAGAAFGAVGGMEALRKIIPSTVIELAALTLMLIQSAVLFKMSLGPQIAAFVGNLKAIGAAFLENARTGGTFKSGLSTITAGLKLAELGAFAASAAFLLFFAKADFSNELGSKFDKLGDQMSAAMEKAANATQILVDKQKGLSNKLPDFKSQGFDLTLGIGQHFGMENGFRTDDVIKGFRDTQLNNVNQSEKSGVVSKQEAEKLRKEITENNVTVAEKNFNDNLLKLDEMGEKAGAIIDESGLLNGTFKNNKAGIAFEKTEQIDTGIKDLQSQRLDLVAKPGATKDPEIKKQVEELEKQIKEKLKQREEAVKPVKELRDSIMEADDAYVKAVKGIEESNLPAAAKQQAKDRLNPKFNSTRLAKEELEKRKAIDLSPLGNQFTDVKNAIDKSNIEFENTNQKRELDTTKSQQSVYEDFASGKLDEKQLDAKLKTIEKNSLQDKSSGLTANLDERRLQLRDLLAVPSPGKEQKETIEKTQKEIRDKELELAKTRIQIAQNIADAKSKAEEDALSAFQEANAKAASIIQRQQTEQVAGIKSRQMRGEINQEQADKLLAENNSNAALGDITEVKRQMADFQSKRSTLNPKEAVKQELELQKGLADANLKYIEAELSRIENRKQQIIRDLEFANRKAEATIQLSQTTSTTQVKEAQLSGNISPEQASKLQNQIDQKATVDKISLIKSEIAKTKQLRIDGTYDVKTATEKELQLNQELAASNQSLIDQQIQAQQLLRDAIEKTFQRRKAQLDLEKAQGDVKLEFKVLDQFNSKSPRDLKGLELSNKSNSLKSDRTNIEKQMALLNDQRDAIPRLKLSPQEADDKRKQNDFEFNQLRVSQIKNEQEQILTKQEIEINGIERAKQAEDNRHKQVISNLDAQKAKLDLINQSLELTSKLNESRLNLSKALSDATIAPLEIKKTQADTALGLSRRLDDKELAPKVRSAIKEQLSSLGMGEKELDILEKRSQIEDEIAAKKLEALKTEQEYQRAALQLDLQRQRIAAEMAIYEAESAQLSASKSKIEAESALKTAQSKKDDIGVKAAEIGIELAAKEAALANKKLALSKKGLEAQDELASNAIRAQEATQRTAIDQQVAADGARKQASALEKVEASVKKITSKSDTPQADQSAQSPPPGWENPYIQKPGEDLFAYNLRINTAKMQGQIVETNVRKSVVDQSGFNYDEALNRRQGNPPASDFDLKSSNPTGKMPASAAFDTGTGGLKKLLTDTNELPESLRKLVANTSDKSLQLGDKTNPLDLKTPDIAAQVKTAIAQATPTPDTNMATIIIDGFKNAISGVEQRMDKLSASITALANTPRSLTVQSCSPVDDAASILRDIANNSAAAAAI